MADQKLVQYVKQYLNQGYDANSIRNYLLRYGYNNDVIEQAINAETEEDDGDQNHPEPETLRRLHQPIHILPNNFKSSLGFFEPISKKNAPESAF